MPLNHAWTLLTNHGVCLLLIATRGGGTVRGMADAMGVTERSAARMLADLRAEGYLVVSREGRRNRYEIQMDAPLRHPVGEGYRVRDLLEGLLRPTS
jgi:hypothetical protein